MKELLQKIMSEVDWEGMDYFMTKNAIPKEHKQTPLGISVAAYISSRSSLELMLRSLCEEHNVKCKID